MPAIRCTVFAGMFPLRNVRLLPDEAAADGSNLEVASGALEGTPSPLAVATIGGAAESAYRIPTGPASDLTASYWLEFGDPNTDVARSPIVNDSFERYYWASPTQGARYNTKLRILGGQPSFALGVVRPTGTCVVSPAPTPTPVETRSYLVTFRTIYGEESQPSNPTEASGSSSGTWALTNIPQPVPNPDRAPIDKIVIYRTITSSAGISTFYQVAEINVGVTTYNDNLSSTTVSGQGQLRSTNWDVPIAGLEGLIAMPNGILVGFKGNTLYFSENYRPHAWPAAYATTTQYPIVGLGVYGNTCVIATTGTPAAVTGVKSSTMNLTSYSAPAPCVSRQSVVSAHDGVYYASEDGLVFISASGIAMPTEGFIGRKEWSAKYAPSTIKAMFVDGRYTATRQIAGATRGFSFRVDKLDDGVTWLDVDTLATARSLRVDPWSGKGVYVAQDGTDRRVFQWRPVNATPLEYRWKSKEFLLPRPVSMSAAQIFFEPPTAPMTEIGRLRVWADGVLRFDQPFTTDKREIRLPSGFLASVWQFEVESFVKIMSVHMATTVTELRNVA
jgi:hypothetical protein